MTLHAPGGGNLSVKANEIFVDGAYAGTQSNGSEGAPYTTITGALAVAAAGDLIIISPGAYAEDLTLVDGVNLKSLLPESVTITGTATATDASFVMQGLDFIDDTAGSAFHFTGTAADVGRFILCNFNATATGDPAFSADNTAGSVNFEGCSFAVAGANAAECCQIESGTATFRECDFAHATNTNESLVAEGDAATAIECRDCTFAGTVSSEAAVANPTMELNNCAITVGAVSGVVVAAGNTVTILDSSITSTDAANDAIDGAGTVTIKDLAFLSTADEIAATVTVTHYLGSQIQHGSYTEGAGAGARAVVFAQPFPSTAVDVVCDGDWYASAILATGFTLNTSGNATQSWIAIHD